MREVSEIAQSTLDRVRSLSQALHPVMLDQAGFENTIDWYIATVEKQAAIAIAYEKSGAPFAVAGGAGIHIYRILQEALNNVVRHAHATEVWLRVKCLPSAICLSIEDNGQGFDGVVEDAFADGLRNMRQRMEEIDGRFEMKSEAGSGTRISIIFPWSAHH